MFNRYLDPEGWAALQSQPPAEPAAAFRDAPPRGSPSAFSSLQELLGGSIGGISTETLILVVMVYFLVADREEDDHISDTLLIIGALVLFGL